MRAECFKIPAQSLAHLYLLTTMPKPRKSHRRVAPAFAQHVQLSDMHEQMIRNPRRQRREQIIRAIQIAAAQRIDELARWRRRMREFAGDSIGRMFDVPLSA
jgi:hypothetical protein